MKEYGQFCPVAMTSEVFAERWTPLIIRELCCGPAYFNDLRRRLPRLSKTLLAQRLKELEAVGIVSITPKEKGRGHAYSLTQSGQEFRGIITLMSRWGQRWTQNTIKRTDLDPTFLLFSVRGQIDRQLLPAKRLVLRVEFRGVPQDHAYARRWWLVFQRPDIDVCLKDPGHTVDVSMRADLALFWRAWLGYVGLDDAVARRAISFDGAADQVERVKVLLDLRDAPHERPLVYAPPEQLNALRA
jgi:DNA-binding HxlR family transcriptional regulator